MSEQPGPEMVGVIVHTSEERYPQMRRFYTEILGLRPRSDRAGFVNFEWGEVRLTLHLHQRVKGRSNDPDRVLINFAVEDLAAWHQHLTASEVPCRRPPAPEEWGGLVATYSDPDGNLVQLLQF